MSYKFPTLHAALKSWTEEIATKLSTDRQVWQAYPPFRWERKEGDTYVRVPNTDLQWNPHAINRNMKLTSARQVREVAKSLPELDKLLGEVVGTPQGISQIDFDQILRSVLPSPSQDGKPIMTGPNSFEEKYMQLEEDIVAEQVFYKTVISIKGLSLKIKLPVQLTPDLALDLMSDKEVATALRTGIIQPPFPSLEVPTVELTGSQKLCLRFITQEEVLVGSDAFAKAQGGDKSPPELRDNQIEHYAYQFLKAAGLVTDARVNIGGYFSQMDEKTLFAYGLSYKPMSKGFAWKSVELDSRKSKELIRVWTILNSRGESLGAALNLAMQRLTYQAERERVEDELLDAFIAAEALYLAGLDDKSELSYKLRLYAALWDRDSDESPFPTDTFKFMRDAYKIRSIIAHGSQVTNKDLKINGKQLEMQDVVKQTEAIIRRGLLKAVLKIDEGSLKSWPVDWHSLM